VIDPLVVVVTSLQGANTALVSLEQPFQSRPAVLGFTGTEDEFNVLAGGVTPDGAVRQAGSRLFAGLSANDDVKTAIGQALQIDNDKRRPLILELRQVDARIEELPWETLYADGSGFLGLDARWSIGRRVHSTQGQPTSVLASPLRIAVVLSCLGIPAADEWATLRAAVDAAVGSFPVEVLLFVGEPDLQDAIEDDRPRWLRALEGIPESASDLAGAFRRHRADGWVPHVLHFFCHGSLNFSPHLEIATKSDWASPMAQQSSLTLEPSEINQLSTPADRPWLVVLNCCLGAAGADAGTGAASQPLALDLVREGGYPAVIGMREAVDAADATTFSSCLYPELFALLATPVGEPEAPPDWSRLLISARQRLAEEAGVPRTQAAEKRPQWTFPVLYVRYRMGFADFSVLRAAPPAVDRGDETPPAPPTASPADDLLATLLRDMLAVSGSDAPANWPADLQARLAGLRGGRP
jgi:hypothetical protein